MAPGHRFRCLLAGVAAIGYPFGRPPVTGRLSGNSAPFAPSIRGAFRRPRLSSWMGSRPRRTGDEARRREPMRRITVVAVTAALFSSLFLGPALAAAPRTVDVSSKLGAIPVTGQCTNADNAEVGTLPGTLEITK